MRKALMHFKKIIILYHCNEFTQMIQKIVGQYSAALVPDLHIRLELGPRYLALWIVAENNNQVISFECFSWNEPVELDENVLESIESQSKILSYKAFATATIYDNRLDLAIDNLAIDLLLTKINRAEILTKDVITKSVLQISDNAQLHIFCLPEFCLLLGYQAENIFCHKWVEYHNPMDVIYHIAHIIRTNELDEAKIKILLSGFVSVQSPLYDHIFKFFSNIEFEHWDDPKLSNLVISPLEDYYFVPFLKY